MTKRKLVAVLVAFAMLIGGLPVSGFEANAAQKHCNNSDDCTVCIVADMINSRPEAEDIDVYNAAAVVEQIHAIDRIKVELSDDEYEEMIRLVDAENDGSGYGVDVPSKYLDAVKAINDLNAGGSLYIQKKYSVGDKELDWNKTDATLKIKCIDENTKFEPLKVTLANATDSYLGAIGAYSENADGWTNQYILPAGTYKITETGYNAVTADGEKLVTAATYDVDGEETTDYAIVEVKAGEESSVAVYNSYGTTYSPTLYLSNSKGNVGINLMLSEDGKEFEIGDENISSTNDRILPNVGVKLTNIRNSSDVVEIQTNELRSTKLTIGATYSIELDEEAKKIYTLKDPDVQLEVTGLNEFVVVSENEGAEFLNDGVSALIYVDAKYDDHSYVTEYPSNNIYARKYSATVLADGEEVATLELGRDAYAKKDDYVDSYTVKRLKYNENGDPIKWAIDTSENIGGTFSTFFEIAKIVDEAAATTFKIECITYDVPLKIMDGVKCKITDWNGKEVWNSETGGSSVNVIIGYFHKIEYEEVPVGYSTKTQTFSINQNNELTYNSEIIDSNVLTGDIETLNIVPNRGEEHNITCIAGGDGSGTIAVDKDKAVVGDKVKITAVPDNESYVADNITVTSGGKNISVSDNTFVMPDGNVTVKVNFEKKTAEAPLIEILGSKTETEGIYDSRLYVTITSEAADAKIYYTLDGTKPTKESLLYSERFVINVTEGATKDVVIRAIVVKGNGAVSEEAKEEVKIKVPNEPPIVAIMAGKVPWYSFSGPDDVSFGMFFKENDNIMFAAHDISEIKEFYYLIADREYSEEELKSDKLKWVEYTEQYEETVYEPLVIERNKKYIVYAKAVDNAGNIGISNSQGIVLYTDSSVDKTKYEYTQIIDGALEIPVNFNGNTVSKIKIGEDVLTEEDYKADYKKGTIALAEPYLDALAGGESSIMISFNPMGEKYVDNEGNAAPAEVTILADITASKRNNDGSVVVDENRDGTFNEEDPTYIPYDTDKDGTNEYIEVKPNDDGTYSDDVDDDDQYGGEKDNTYKSDGKGGFIKIGETADQGSVSDSDNNSDKGNTTKTNDDFNLLLIMALIMFTMAAMAAVVMIGRRRGCTARR